MRMNGHERRRQRIIGRIKKSALELFTTSGADKVSMDAIAARAHVSKVTIYKYFHSKQELRRQVVNLYIDDALSDVEKLLGSDLDFLEKLKITLLAQLNSLKVAGSQALFDLLEEDGQVEGNLPGSLNDRIREIMFRFYQEGKEAGYIEPGLSFDLLYLFSEIFQAGFKAKSMDYKADPIDSETLEQLVHLCFYGIIRRN
jgi:AcrR family transcriptional regulator